ncbi:hypothetical protein K1W54_38755 [Micromonospora sp. CPCC 205371]|nr:hypothetical protein [Micromonospora sp. CPCC 205371]
MFLSHQLERRRGRRSFGRRLAEYEARRSSVLEAARRAVAAEQRLRRHNGGRPLDPDPAGTAQVAALPGGQIEASQQGQAVDPAGRCFGDCGRTIKVDGVGR